MKARSAGKLVIVFAVVNALLLGWGWAHRWQPGELTITFLDVGQGDAAVLETPSGRVLVVDTGGISPEGDDDAGRRVVTPFLKHEGINRIDVLLLTHPHADHIGGAATLLERFPVGLLMDNGEPAESPLVPRILTAAKTHGAQYRAARRGQVIELGDGVTVRVLAPTPAETHGPTNDASIVLRVEYERATLLLTGDAEAEEEADLVADRQPLACDVLKVAHHGSHTSTTPAFLAAAHPRFAVVSVGAHNVYAHPNPDILTRLRESGAHIYRTDKNGAITCHSNGVTVRLEPMQP